jgi:hypothetical protein
VEQLQLDAVPASVAFMRRQSPLSVSFVATSARRPKLRVDRQPFLASKAVIFGVNSTGPHILPRYL